MYSIKCRLPMCVFGKPSAVNGIAGRCDGPLAGHRAAVSEADAAGAGSSRLTVPL